MAKDKDPEQLLAEALRAQAVQVTGPPATPGFGLLSGDDLGLASRVQTQALAEEPYVEIEPPRERLGGWAILLLALVFGLACGAVVGLLTVL
ncbi:hypothetical protein LWC34_20945 [Kibdelosporangium philippinense]|uniref:DUF3040 domain-containing protein n=1 Tax=Kibdelosporangium philippinense TaxID=211113 RepID=A0ABS8ZF17_9PSEU|nr:hypothetical protein [Kibdelosporangium philippinense]MCE7005276.1 hypothetical protein [Kibdelosporangium philippinense]